MTLRRGGGRVELVCVGSELLSGKSSTHGAYLAQQLATIGLVLSRDTTVADDPVEMRAAFRECWRRADLIICAGGLGPTFDDITREAWASVLHRPLRFVPSLLDNIRAKFSRRGLLMPRENRRQAYVLSGAKVIENKIGTAPGQLFLKDRKILALFPGPRQELAPMAGDLVAFLSKTLRLVPRVSRTWRIFGIPESIVDERLDAVRLRFASGKADAVIWGILAHNFVIDIKVAIASSASPTRRLEIIDKDIRRIFGLDIFGVDGETLEQVVGRELKKTGSTLSTAESCTGGLLAERLTKVSGSSDYFRQGYVSYSNESKVRLLGVGMRTLVRHGAVSESCAKEMAIGCLRRAGTDLSIAITGIAGPSGGTPQKPVGLVYIALADSRRVRCRKHLFIGDRDQIRERSALSALDWLRRELVKLRTVKPSLRKVPQEIFGRSHK